MFVLEVKAALDHIIITESKCGNIFVFIFFLFRCEFYFEQQNRRFADNTFEINVFLNTDCANWTFGSNCDDCACVRAHTDFCDKNNGTCHCNQGYTGEACQCEDNGEPCPHCKHLMIQGYTVNVCHISHCLKFRLDIRLVNGNTTSMGRIEVVTNGVWSTICDSNWNHDDATVVCKQLGLGK